MRRGSRRVWLQGRRAGQAPGRGTRRGSRGASRALVPTSGAVQPARESPWSIPPIHEIAGPPRKADLDPPSTASVECCSRSASQGPWGLLGNSEALSAPLQRWSSSLSFPPTSSEPGPSSNPTPRRKLGASPQPEDLTSKAGRTMACKPARRRRRPEVALLIGPRGGRQQHSTEAVLSARPRAERQDKSERGPASRAGPRVLTLARLARQAQP
jgi:hypothetical protein